MEVEAEGHNCHKKGVNSCRILFSSAGRTLSRASPLRREDGIYKKKDLVNRVVLLFPRETLARCARVFLVSLSFTSSLAFRETCAWNVYIGLKLHLYNYIRLCKPGPGFIALWPSVAC
jgi:hypothetical protein